jgi:hypothetical protein
MTAATQLRALSLPTPRAGRFSGSAAPEFELLVDCCMTAWDPAGKAKIQQLLELPLHWEELIRLAEHHGLVQLLFQSAAGCSGLIPARHYEALRLRSQQGACRALWFTQELGRILKHLARAGIEAIAHKGPALATLLYGDVAQRQFHDLDILVRPRDVSRARLVLGKSGYRGDREFTAREEQALLRSGYEEVLHGPQGRNLVELQWRLLPRFYAVNFDLEGLFARAKLIQFAEHQCRILSSEDLLLALCVHAAKHGWTQLSWLRDIVQLARRPGLAWHFVATESKRLGIERIIAVQAILGTRLFGSCSRFPLGGLSGSVADGADGIADEVLTSLRNGVTRSTQTLEYFRWMLKLRERRLDQARFLWRLFSTPLMSEWETVKLPAALFSLYPLVRAVRLAKRFTTGVL